MRVVVQRQEIVVVAAHFARRLAMPGQRDAGKRERALREQRHLDAAGDAQLLLEPLLLGLLLQQLLDAARSSS